jgi:hypothetical protein
VELWLDAFSAIDAHTLPLSTYTWLRAEAARLRGEPDPAGGTAGGGQVLDFAAYAAAVRPLTGPGASTVEETS